MSKIDSKLEKYLREADKIDWDSVKEALMKTAEDIFDEVDEEKVKGILDAVKKKNPKDEEDAIGIGQGMLRSEE